MNLPEEPKLNRVVSKVKLIVVMGYQIFLFVRMFNQRSGSSGQRFSSCTNQI